MSIRSFYTFNALYVCVLLSESLFWYFLGKYEEGDKKGYTVYYLEIRGITIPLNKMKWFVFVFIEMGYTLLWLSYKGKIK